MIRRLIGPCIGAVVFLGGALGAFAADQSLLFHAEAGGERRIVRSEDADRSFNPASVLKVATSLLALKILGPDHRYVTDFACRGRCSIEEGHLQGDLVIFGGADPDFQAENAWLVAHELSKLGISRVTGDLVVEGIFFQGWEHGVEKRQTDVRRRAQLMCKRFRQALDVSVWDQTLYATWEEAAVRQGWPQDPKPGITFGGAIRMGQGGSGVLHPLARHRSNPLKLTLKRFNTFSNNDIIRVVDPIGGPGAIEALLKEITVGLPGEIRVATASGERINRLTTRQVVRLLWAFDEACRELGLDPGDILPVPGCDPGSLPRMLPRLAGGESARTAVVKSGTLTTTDGGVAVLAGFFRSLEGENTAFCVAAPRAGGRLEHFRRAEETWLLDLMQLVGGASHRSCGPPVVFSDKMADAQTTLRSGIDVTDGDGHAAK